MQSKVSSSGVTPIQYFKIEFVDLGTMKKIKYLGFSVTCFAILFKLMSWQYADKLLIAGFGTLGIYYLIKIFKK